MRRKIQQTRQTRHYGIPNILFSLPTMIIGYHIHSSIFWAIIDFIFWPIIWIKWFICQDVTISIIKDAFAWFLK